MTFYFPIQLPQPGLKPLSNEDSDSKSGFDSATTSTGPKYKFSDESQKKLRQSDQSMNRLPKANEAFCLDMYKHSAPPSLATKNVSLFSGLNQTVKVSFSKRK